MRFFRCNYWYQNFNFLELRLLLSRVTPYYSSLLFELFENRPQVVKYQNHYSSPLPVHNRVSQGTLLGALLFPVMINSLLEEFIDRWKFVDDLMLVETCYQNLVRNPMSSLNDIADDATDSDMRVNPPLNLR